MRSSLCAIAVTTAVVLLSGCGGDGGVQEATPTVATGSPANPADTFVIYRDTVGDIHALDLQTGEAYRRPIDPANEALLTAECTRDGSRIAYLRQDFRSVTREILIQGDGAPAEPLQVPAQAQGITWSPDGKQIAYIDFAVGEGYRLATIDVATGKEQEVVRGPNFGGSPRWSPDGRYLAYHAQAGLQTQIMLYELGSGAERPTQLTSGDLGSFDPDWSSDSSRLFVATTNDAGDILQIYELDVESGDARQLTNSDVYKRFPRLSPDGSLIGFTGSIVVPQVSRDVTAAGLHSFGIFLVSPDGSNERALTADPRLNPGPQDPYLDAFLLGWCARGPWLDTDWVKVEAPG